MRGPSDEASGNDRTCRFDVEDGKQVGKIQDFIVNDDWEIEGIELENKGLFTNHVKMVQWEDIVAYGEDAVMIRNQQAVRKTGPTT